MVVQLNVKITWKRKNAGGVKVAEGALMEREREREREPRHNWNILPYQVENNISSAY
ncbi:hypothetical protein MBAV_000977 [Candidatus Magnetobacterium bavaricum]|uniref:Uncharacterized protein n=1 Tax=Candidatus Magnetobacterium bavaricum TaxID=29290 RepID=A0A0F3H1P1_9BACT|nr:hypothetical protein MBAV_000977 [Candidatus Magnetobacterium bavaricum]